MDNNILKILNEELLESKRLTKLAEQRLDLHSREFKERSKQYEKHQKVLEEHQKALEEIHRTQQEMQLRQEEQQKTSDKHHDLLNQHKAGFEILFSNMQKMGDRLDLELRRLRKN